jgi:hypothetical protein
LAVATLATVLLAGGFGLAVEAFAAPHAQPAPQLKTVPAVTLSRLGITLAAPAQPLYCGVAGAVVDRLPAGAAGCAISRSAAESAARQGSGARVVESVLAQVSSNGITMSVHDLLGWVVVTQQTRGSNCVQGVGGYQFCFGGARTGLTWTQIVIVDARSGGIVTQQRLSPIGGGRTRPGLQRPGWPVPTQA